MKNQCHILMMCLIIIYSFLFPSLAGTQTLNTILESYQKPIATHFQSRRALKSVEYFQKFWRDGGNADFNQCMKFIHDRLKKAGFHHDGRVFKLEMHQSLVSKEQAWQPHNASLEIIAPVKMVLQTLKRAKMSLCINSHATPRKGIRAQIIAIDALPDSEMTRLKGQIAYSHRPPRAIFQKAILQGHAAGLISSYLPGYNQPQTHPELVSMSGLPQTDQSSAFGFKISFAQQQLLDSLLARGQVEARARVEAKFLPKKVLETSAEIIGSQRPNEKIVLIAHLDEPGANDNASGSATLLEMALTMKKLIETGKLARPKRSIKFMWVEEFHTILRWQKNSPQTFRQVKAAIVLDMVGENTALTGGQFLIEKMPDPSAIWTRPPDQHTEWGKTSLPQSALNDLLIAACEIISRQDRNWHFRANPFEGGSDHVPFIHEGIPAILAWHFTDVFYHTSGDQVDKVSPQEMARVARATGSVALFLASCSKSQAAPLLEALTDQAYWRITNEMNNSMRLLQTARATSNATFQEQVRILQAWARWYQEAFQSVLQVPIISGRAIDLREKILFAKRQFSQFFAQSMKRLEDVTKTLQNSHRR